MFGAAALHQLVSEVAHGLDKLTPQCMVGYAVQSLQLTLVTNRPHHGHTLSIFEVAQERLFDFPGTLINSARLLFGETVLQVLRGSDFAAVLVLNFEGDVSEHPDEFGHVAVELLLILAVGEFVIGPDMLRQGSHHLQVADRTLVDATDRVVDEVGRDKQGKGEDLGVCLGVFLQAIRALGIKEEDKAVKSGIKHWLRPHPNALRAAMHCRVHFKLH